MRSFNKLVRKGLALVTIASLALSSGGIGNEPNRESRNNLCR